MLLNPISLLHLEADDLPIDKYWYKTLKYVTTPPFLIIVIVKAI